jgi:hypothetical protein
MEGDVTTIYAVSSGDYSDYSVLALFSTQELAQDYVDTILAGKSYDTPRIEEYELDPEVPSLRAGLSAWLIGMDRDGNVIRADQGSPGFRMRGPYFICCKQGRGFAGQEPRGIVFACVAKSVDHAIKIVNEWRIQLIAENRWTLDQGEFNKIRDRGDR